MKKYIICVLILVIIAVSGCIGTGKYGYATINETGKIGGFNQILVVGGPNHLIITQGDNESLVFKTGKNEISNVKTGVSNNKLYLNSTTPVTYYVTIKDINSIEMIGGPGQMQATNLKLDNLTIKLNNGVGNITNLTVPNLSINLNHSGIYATNLTVNQLTSNTYGLTSGNITNLTANNLIVNENDNSHIFISGTATNQKVTVNGNYNATNLINKTANIYVNGPGYATVRVSNLLKTIINGPGQIYYIGNLQITRQISFTGTMTQVNG